MWAAPLCCARARAGDRAGALTLLSEPIERAGLEYVSPSDLAIAFTGVGEHECALDHLERAFSERVMRMSCSAIPSSMACARNHDTGACLIASACQVLLCE